MELEGSRPCFHTCLSAFFPRKSFRVNFVLLQLPTLPYSAPSIPPPKNPALILSGITVNAETHLETPGIIILMRLRLGHFYVKERERERETTQPLNAEPSG